MYKLFEPVLIPIHGNPREESRPPLLHGDDQGWTVKQHHDHIAAMIAYESFMASNNGLGQLFYQHMVQDPDATAIVDGDIRLTYAELHIQATKLGEALTRGNTTLEEPIGILVQHGIFDAVAQVGIMYAGGSCVPFDPELPDQQVERRLNRLAAKYILVDSPNSARRLPFAEIVIETTLSSDAIPSLQTPFPIKTGPGHRTHLIHTSGTTSEPKVVQISARSIVHVSAHAPFEPVLKSDVIAHGNRTSFDISLFDIWGALAQGASIAVLSKATLLDMDAFAAAIKQYKISVMTITTPLVNLAAATNPSVFQPMRVLITGGEAVNVEAVKKIFEAGPPEHLVNAYGPTECCIFCLTHKITPKDLEEGRVSIGHAIGSNVALVCDEDGKPAEDDEEGELLVGGPGVSIGYLDDTEKMQPHLSTLMGPGWRRDHQVKIRGYRVELAAIESVMFQTGYFCEVLAMGVEPETAGLELVLVAFAVLANGLSTTVVSDAQAALTAELPQYMVPHIQIVDRIPLNSHAKVDRKALKEAYYRRHPMQQKVSSKRKRNSTREELAWLWETILAMHEPSLSDNDDFFQLGGSSLQASLLITLIQKTFNTKVSLLALYDNPKLGQLSSLIDCNQGKELDTVQNQRETWVEDTMVGDAMDLDPPAAPVVDWGQDTEGRVFLTGATGFVGAFLLAELLELPKVQQVACLVRASDTATALRRLQESLAKYDLWRDMYKKRLLPLPGKLEDIWLGLGEKRFREIADWASVIFHLGALVNYTKPYSWHRPANVEGTLNVARLAITGHRLKGLHYCSSVSCFGPTGTVNKTKLVLEDGPLLPHLDALPYDHGYAQSQWVVEQLLHNLRHRGVPVAVYRPGFITGHSVTGACNSKDFFSRLLCASIRLGHYPGLPDQRKEFITVDYVTSTMLSISSSVFSLGHAYHLVPPTQEQSPDMDSVMKMLAQASKHTVKRASYEEWIEMVSTQSDRSLQPLLPMLEEKVLDGKTRWELYKDMPTYDTTNTQRALDISKESSVPFRVLDMVLMRRYLDHLARH